MNFKRTFLLNEVYLFSPRSCMPGKVGGKIYTGQLERYLFTIYFEENFYENKLIKNSVVLDYFMIVAIAKLVRVC